MKKVLWAGALALAVALVALAPAPVAAQEKLEGKAFDSAYVAAGAARRVNVRPSSG